MGNNNKPAHHRGPHQRLAAQACAQAYAQPDYRCPTCGLTLEQGITQWGDNGRWDGGHKVDGRSDLGYHAQHRHCNRRLGAIAGNQPNPTSRQW